MFRAPVVVTVAAGQRVQPKPLHELSAENNGQPLIVDDVLPLGHHNPPGLLLTIARSTHM